MKYLEDVEQLGEDRVHLVGDAAAVGTRKVADAGDSSSEDLILVPLLKAELDVLPEVISDSQIVGNEEGKGRDHIKAVTINIINLLVVSNH